MKFFKNKSFISLFSITFLLFFVVGYFLFRSQMELNPTQKSKYTRGAQLPNLTFKDFNGNDFELKQWDNKLVLISFWASWCEPCKEELPAFEKLIKTINHKDFEILAINLDNDKNEGKKFFDQLTTEHNISFKTFYDPDNETAKRLALESLPANILMNQAGKEVFLSYGLQDWTNQKVLEIFQSNLAKSESL